MEQPNMTVNDTSSSINEPAQPLKQPSPVYDPRYLISILEKSKERFGVSLEQVTPRQNSKWAVYGDVVVVTIEPRINVLGIRIGEITCVTGFRNKTDADLFYLEQAKAIVDKYQKYLI